MIRRSLQITYEFAQCSLVRHTVGDHDPWVTTMSSHLEGLEVGESGAGHWLSDVGIGRCVFAKKGYICHLEGYLLSPPHYEGPRRQNERERAKYITKESIIMQIKRYYARNCETRRRGREI